MSEATKLKQEEYTVNPLSDVLGAEIVGLDVSYSLDEETIYDLRQAFQNYHLLCFRNQCLSDEQLTAFSKQFGPLESFPEEDMTKGAIEVYHVANISMDGKHLASDDPRVIYQRNNGRWHTDSSYRYIPSLASIMYGVEVLPEDVKGGETGFSNMLQAYASLPEDRKSNFKHLHQVHSYGEIRRLEPSIPPMSDRERNALPPVTHPIVRVHPDRDYQRSLYFTSNTSLEIGGMTHEEGRELHGWLVDYVSNPKFCYFHRWCRNDLVMWDNRVLLHRAIEYDYSKYRRVLRRTTIGGENPVMGPYWPEVIAAQKI